MDAATLRGNVEMFRKNTSKFEINDKGKGVASNYKFFSREDLEEAIGEKIVVCSIGERKC
jgi:hypothetical protein